MKKRSRIAATVIGYTLDSSEIDMLLLAAETNDGLAYVGREGFGLTGKQRTVLQRLFAWTAIDKPFVDCRVRGAKRVTPKAFCVVRYLERTPAGELRDAVIEDLVIA